MGLSTTFIRPGNTMNVAIIGAGVMGLSCACELVDRGVSVTVYDQSSRLGQSACSWFAGGMLAPWCEQERAEPAVLQMGLQAIDWWQKHTRGVHKNGSLVISLQRDRRDLKHFAELTQNHRWLDHEEIGELEPDLSGRFEKGLYFADEAHLDPRDALLQLSVYLETRGGAIRFGESVQAEDLQADRILDCRGLLARDRLPQMRGVKGEMIILESREIHFSRPIRLVHPRYPIYIVPREDNRFMLGATMIENDKRSRISTRSMLELLSVVYALHPAFGESEIVETGVDLRPALPNNLPVMFTEKNILVINGLFRHGFLLSPALAMQAAQAVLDEQKFLQMGRCA